MNNELKNNKIYNNFTDVYGNVYSFSTYAEFSMFWFNLKRKTAIAYFPEFKKLQSAAANSKEARTKINVY